MNKTSLLFMLVAGIMSATFAQDLGTQQVIVQTGFQPVIIDANKINDVPQLNDSTPPVPKLTYGILKKKIPTSFQVEPIQSATMKGEPLVKLYRNYAKLGFGNYQTPYFEFFHTTLRSKKYVAGAHAKHLSGHGDIKKVGFAGYSDNEVNVFAKYFINDNYTFSANADYARNVYHYYGFDTFIKEDTILDKQTSKHRFSDFTLSTALLSSFKDSSKLHHTIWLRYNNFNDNLGAFENNVYLKANGYKYIESEIIGANVSVDYYNNKTSIDESNNAIIRLNPHASLNKDPFILRLGMAMDIEAGSKSLFYFYPDINASYIVVPEIFIAYGNLTGQTIRNSYKKLATENPFIIPTVDLANSHQRLYTDIGFKGNISSKIGFDVKGKYYRMEQMPLFVNFPNNIIQNKFTVSYDDVNVFGAEGTLTYERTEKLNLRAEADYNKYMPDTSEQAWHSPALRLKIGARYNIADKFILSFNVYRISKQYARIPNFGNTVNEIQYSTRTIRGFNDINLGIEYRYNKKMAAFINFNNMTAFRYYRWNNYPTQRFNFIAGLTYSF